MGLNPVTRTIGEHTMESLVLIGKQTMKENVKFKHQKSYTVFF